MSQGQVKPARGAYRYGDFYTGEILSLNNDVQSVLVDTDPIISSFGEDEAGEIYVVVGLGGTVHRIISLNAAPTDPPSAAMALSGGRVPNGPDAHLSGHPDPGVCADPGGYLPRGAPARFF